MMRLYWLVDRLFTPANKEMSCNNNSDNINTDSKVQKSMGYKPVCFLIHNMI
jgi:hypothetical protein